MPIFVYFQRRQQCNEKMMMVNNSNGVSLAYEYYKYGLMEENTSSVTNTTDPMTASMIASQSSSSATTTGYISQNISSLFGPTTTKGNDKSEYIFDRPDIKATFIAIYTAVFCFCFFGKLISTLQLSFIKTSLYTSCVICQNKAKTLYVRGS